MPGKLYHGTSAETAEKIKKAGGFTEETAKGLRDLTGLTDVDPKGTVSLTRDLNTAKLYAEGPRPDGRTGAMITFSAKSIKIASESDIKKLGLQKLKYENSEKFIEELRKRGFDGFDTSSPHDEMIETVVFNKEKLRLLK